MIGATTTPRLDGALCTQTDPEIFHPSPGRPDLTRKAVAICENCPAKDPCLDWALTDRTLTGILGATTYTQRKRLMKWTRL